MKLRAPYFVDNLFQDQPYASMLLVAPYCDFKCKECQNLPLSTGDVSNFSPRDLAVAFHSNPFVEGVTLGGLEFTKSPKEDIDDFLHFVRLAKIPKVTLYTRETLEHYIVLDVVQKLLQIPTVTEAYLKTGIFDPSRPAKRVTLEPINWHVTLSSDNQNFIKLK